MSLTANSPTPLAYTHDIAARMRDENPGRHVDAVECLRLVDEVRQRFVTHATLPPAPGRGGGLLGARSQEITYVVAAQHVNHLAELRSRPFEPFHVRMWVSRIGGSSFDVSAELGQDPGAAPAVRAIISMVLRDRTGGGAWPIDEPTRELMQAYLADPVPLR